MHFLSLPVVGLLTALALAAPSSRHVIHEQRYHLPSGWTKRSAIEKRTILPVRVGLTESNLEHGYDKLMEVSDPDSPKYGGHWTHKEVADFFAPSAESKDAVREWLHSSGIDSSRVKSAGGWLDFHATVAEVEELLKTQYHVYEHSSGVPHVACKQYSVPQHVSHHIDFITPTLHFDREVGTAVAADIKAKRAKKVKRSPGSMRPQAPVGIPKVTNPGVPLPELPLFLDSATCAEAITPACLRELYNIPIGTLNKSSYGIVEYAPETYEQVDLTEFNTIPLLNDAGVPLTNAPKVEGIDGGYLKPLASEDPYYAADYQAEAELDLQYGIDLVYPQQVTLYQVGDNGVNADMISFNNFLNGIDKSYCTYEGGDDYTVDEKFPDSGGYLGKQQCGVWKPTAVISTSYGYNEHDLTPKYEARQCNEYMKLGLAGISVLYSSGDNGVAGNGDQCINKDGSYNNGTTGRFNPSFPGVCPYVTSVGATQLPTGGSPTTPEVACESVIFSGGGFSNNFALPSYQSSAVAAYYKNHKPAYSAGQYNNTQKARGIPDVAANGANYIVIVDGVPLQVFGTSASSPTFGSVITLINNERANKKKSALGFLNPTFYKNPGMFNDIVSGNNPGCGTVGFAAVAGWDPVTGLGTPNYTKMLAVLG